MSRFHTVLWAGCSLLLATAATHAQPRTPSGTGSAPATAPEVRFSEQNRSKPAADIQEDVDQEQASHIEIAPLPVAFGKLNSLRLRADGNLLATDIENELIKIISPAGEVVQTLQPGFAPEILQLTPEGQLYCAGDGRVARLSEDGKVVVEAKLPEQPESSTGASRGGSRPPGVSGLAISPEAVFVTFGSGWSVSSKARLYRYDRNLENPVMLAEGLRGCCQHCDIVFRDGILFLAENAAFRVVQCDAEGKVLGKWGSKGRGELELFGSCCNPMNLAFDAAGVLYTGESGMGRVKRYTVEGQFLGLVGYLDTERFNRGSRLAAACCYFPLAVTPDGDRVYVADVKDNVIRVLERKPAALNPGAVTSG